METRELLGGTKEKSVFYEGSLICPPGKTMILYKNKQKKMSIGPDLEL